MQSLGCRQMLSLEKHLGLCWIPPGVALGRQLFHKAAGNPYSLLQCSVDIDLTFGLCWIVNNDHPWLCEAFHYYLHSYESRRHKPWESGVISALSESSLSESKSFCNRTAARNDFLDVDSGGAGGQSAICFEFEQTCNCFFQFTMIYIIRKLIWSNFTTFGLLIDRSFSGCWVPQAGPWWDYQQKPVLNTIGKLLRTGKVKVLGCTQNVGQKRHSTTRSENAEHPGNEGGISCARFIFLYSIDRQHVSVGTSSKKGGNQGSMKQRHTSLVTIGMSKTCAVLEDEVEFPKTIREWRILI